MWDSMSAPGKSQCFDINMSGQVLVPSFLYFQGVFECAPPFPANALMAGLSVIQSGFLSLSSGRDSLLCIKKKKEIKSHD